ncbi:hypothetical protein [Roseomonas sp. CECT 9278]|uniref:hypothetical protein n=1 Tax=Roseomonas sp. CECT 9278 TaxID=2845823 RepID=UPI001E630BD4|nr:hypothetical protein [Roseomonas sp. CECT 9278]CAH0186641.1 hypothetical protein ROS9278_01579 [Roseomonas sp. CECT 9278]
MTTTRRLACASALLFPGTARALRPDLPAAQACETADLHDTLRADLLRRAGPAPLPAPAAHELAQARCPRCACALFGATGTPRDIPDLRNLF